LVKGGDWDVKSIVGSDLVLNNGGKVASLKFIDNYSTSKLEAKIISEYKKSLNEE
jgi:bifunctional ADP-heptose synthase (sugar kinase/adenylyltransferase)